MKLLNFKGKEEKKNTLGIQPKPQMNYKRKKI